MTLDIDAPSGAVPYDFSAYYVNTRRLAELAGDKALNDAMSRVYPGAPSDKAAQNIRLAAAARILKAWLLQNLSVVRRLEVLLATDQVRTGSLFYTLHDFYCRNVAVGVRRFAARQVVVVSALPAPGARHAQPAHERGQGGDAVGGQGRANVGTAGFFTSAGGFFRTPLRILRIHTRN